MAAGGWGLGAQFPRAPGARGTARPAPTAPQPKNRANNPHGPSDTNPAARSAPCCALAGHPHRRSPPPRRSSSPSTTTDLARPGEAEIRMLAVARESRGRAAGETLVRACVDHARATDGCVRVVLSSQRIMHAAHRIYERLGFTRAPDRDWNPLPDLDDITLLTYELTL
ncbi:acetyltransferase (GNAT) family protein [Streptomyces sp. Ag82_O1-15]|nr:acetyltransferase (GNAT) family protein [Streptomyces sp. Ag82_O1-15]